ncbi:hypothetical protein LOZ80_05070 [Paenibacillus sp. HWE-109]|uniref:GxGYxYP domain-containing protein n=1 Tax=Paenibacillus sp. HWE-109 TaxID=1306526 RepID=UPI001EDD4048|nr:GxGYxYP domain-containing protein [Paenibacillus sp. HWE-109]UKS28310.1 hypothetical protein LOZ80_05070 [Paenibacillus sp. HWE-109]
MKKTKFISMLLAVFILAAAVNLTVSVSPAEAAINWPTGQVLPSFPAPASTLDVIDTTTEYKYQSNGPQVSHSTGHLDKNNWIVQTGVDHENDFMIYGPYATDIPVGINTAFFELAVDNNTANNNAIVRIDVRDNTNGQTLAARDVTRMEWNSNDSNRLQNFNLTFNNTNAGHALEFRVYWYGGSFVRVGAVGTNPKAMEDDAVLFSTVKGLVNKTQPRIYTYDNAVRGEDGKYNWLNTLGLGHTDVTDKYTLITKYRSEINGIVIYDEAVPDTVNLATTIASLNGGIVAPPSVVAKLTAAPYNLPILNDLRGMFTTKIQVYQYLYNNYWSQVTHKVIVGLNPTIKGFLRDYAIAVGAATIWLDPSVTAEDTILRQFLSGMPHDGTGTYMGWWPDEGVGVTRTSEYGVTTIASDYSSNLTVFGGTSRIVNVKPLANKPALQNKIYVSLILSDGDNLQYLEHHFKTTKLWDAPNRGAIPVGWTVSPAMLDAMPGVLNYLYNTATPNDNFIGGPTGVGYTYPNFWTNQGYLDNYIALSDDYSKRSGLKVNTVWNTILGGINVNVGNSYAMNSPSLLGLTSMQSGGQITQYNNLLPAQGLNATYCYSEASVISELNGAITGWNGAAPKFVSIQSEPWDVTYQNLVNAVNTFSGNSNIVFVTPDNYFQLMREYYNLPVDPSTVVKTYEAENTNYAASPFSHTVGRADGDAWSANVAQDDAGFMLWGPYVSTLPAGQLTTTFKVKIDSIAGNNDNVLRLDVRDSTTGQDLAAFDVYRNQFKSNNYYQDFSLSYTNVAGHPLEFRAGYKDNAKISIDKVTTTTSIGKYEAEGTILGHGAGRVVGDGWQANPTQDNANHMVYGPYDSNVPIGNRKVTFALKVDNNTLNNLQVASIDVWDATAGTVLASQNILRQQFTSANQYQNFSLSFNQTTLNHQLEYRVYYNDIATITLDKITIN